MADVHARFAEALRDSDGADGVAVRSPAEARRAEVSADAIARATAAALGAEFREHFDGCGASREFVSLVPIAFARRHGMIGLASTNGSLPVAVSDLASLAQLQVLSRLLGKPAVPVFAPRERILKTINAAYEQQGGQAQQVIEQLDSGQVLEEIRRVATDEDLLDVAGRAPVIRLVNVILFDAIKKRASDVHIQPYADRLVVRMRIDGVLHDAFSPPKALQQEIVSRIKVMGGMNIAERRLAQDGRATVEVGDRVVDLRISTLPTSFGERAVIRLLDKSLRLYRLSDLGMAEDVLTVFRRLISGDHGIILVTGPTGSGKSTTLYAALQELNNQELNILTLEDPIEYRLEGISQTQVSDRKGMTFATGLRHVLRQDPDIIMVGEIRDSETANMAIQSSLTGHLVFSTLHTNDASGAVARLLDLGVEPYLVASSLLGVMAQRLVRQVCPRCSREHKPSAKQLRLWGLPADRLPERLVRGDGCEHCMRTGYINRGGLFELLEVTETIREEILQRAKASTIKTHAVRDGMTTLRGDGMRKAGDGITTIEEVMRVTGRDEF